MLHEIIRRLQKPFQSRLYLACDPRPISICHARVEELVEDTAAFAPLVAVWHEGKAPIEFEAGMTKH